MSDDTGTILGIVGLLLVIGAICINALSKINDVLEVLGAAGCLNR